MKRAALLAIFSAAAAVNGTAPTPDPEFDKVPFREWLAAEGTHMKWTMHVAPPILSVQQRLLARVDLVIDGNELAQRRGKGQLTIFIQFTDGRGQVWQNHGSLDLEKVDENIAAANVSYSQYVFLAPGEYHLAIALYATTSKEYSVRKEKVRIAPLKKDPLPDAWRDMPAVEFRSDAEAPDIYYLPAVEGRLHLPLETHRPAQIEVLVNLTPSEHASGSRRVQSRNLSALLPALKAISQIDLREGAINAAMLDLTRRRVVFHQEQVRKLNWDGIKAALSEADPGTIDVKSLQDRKHNAQFFVREVARRVNAEPAKPVRVLIVLSSPVSFESGEDLQPIHPEATPDYHVFYLRFHEERPRYVAPPLSEGRRGFGGGMGRRRRPDSLESGPAAIDQLEPTLKPLGPRVFDLYTPADFRKALATLLAEISAI